MVLDAAVVGAFWARQISTEGYPKLTWEEGDDPLLGVLLASFNGELVQKLHLRSQTGREQVQKTGRAPAISSLLSRLSRAPVLAGISHFTPD